MSELKMFSPSAIKVYAECPIKYELKYLDKWLPKEADRPYWGTVAGSAFAVGSAWLNEHLGKGTPQEQAYDIELAIQTAYKSIVDDTEAFLGAGGYLERTDLEAVRADVATALTKYANNNPFKGWKEITGVEYVLSEAYGRPRLDIIGRDANGVLSFADIKFKRYLATEYVNKTIEEYRYDWQFLHYAWAMQEYFKESVNAYLCLVRLKTAWQAQLFEFTYSPELIRAVGISAKRWSTDMQNAIDHGSALGVSHDTKFGPCPYKEACLKMNWDETLMAERYIQVPRVK